MQRAVVCVVAHGIAVTDGGDTVIVLVRITVRLDPITIAFIRVAIASCRLLVAALIGRFAVCTT